MVIDLYIITPKYLSIFKNLLYISILFNVVHQNVSLSSNKVSDIKLVRDGITNFSATSNSSEFEVFFKKFNETENASIYSSVHMPDHIIRHSGSDDEGQNLIILPGSTEMKVSFKNITTLIVLKIVGDSTLRYTSHLAYVRHFGEIDIEWDLYTFHFHSSYNNERFVQAFIPVRDGPTTWTVGLGYTLTRSRRRNDEMLSKNEGQLMNEITPTKISSNPSSNSDVALSEPSDSILAGKNKRQDDIQQNLTTFPDALDLAKSEMKEESNIDHARTKKEDSDPDDLLKLDVPYIGIGDCDFPQLNNYNSPLPLNKNELIDLLLTVLKAQCSPSIKNNTLQLFENKLVIFNDPTNISVNRANPIFHKKILGEMEWIDFASAILLSHFSRVFGEQHLKYNSNSTFNKSPNGKRISGTLKTLSILTIRILDTLQSTEKPHAVKFGLLMLVILQAKRSELTSMSNDLKDNCNKCNEEKEVNFNDQVQVYTLMKFIVEKLPDIVAASTSNKTGTMFKTFFIQNNDIFTSQVTDKFAFVF